MDRYNEPNEPDAVTTISKEAVAAVQDMWQTASERANFHEREMERLRNLAEQHERAASSWRLIVDSNPKRQAVSQAAEGHGLRGQY